MLSRSCADVPYDMELSEPSSMQSSAQHQSILVDEQGNPLRINLQAVELEGRPKIVRTLKASGALVVSNAKEATIILVDSTTESGKRLIRTWGHDASKVVLEYTWVRTSLGVGRPLLESNNWGGAMTIDDGKPVTIDGVVVDEDELEEVEALVTNPLPTPRVTPVDPTTQQLESSLVECSDIRSEPNATRYMGPVHPMAQSAVVSATPFKELMTDTREDKPLPQSPSPLPASRLLPYPQPTLPVQQPQSQNTYAYTSFTTQQPFPSSQPQMMPTQSFTHTGHPTSQLPQPQIIYAPSVSHTPLPSNQSQMMSNTTPMNGVNLQTSNFATIMTIMDVMRHMDQSSWLGQHQLPVSQPQINSGTSTFSEKSTTSGPTPSGSTVQTTGKLKSPEIDASCPQDHSMRNITSRKRKQRSSTQLFEDRPVVRRRTNPSRRPPDEMLTPSISRKRSPAVKPTRPPMKRLCKGKEREISSDSPEQSDADELMEASDESYSTHSSVSPPARPRNIIARKKHGEIFLSASGQPLRFFVQVDLHGRHTVVTNIKKNMGKIVNNIADADYSILFARSDTFQGLLNEAIALGKSPILAAFVADCIEEGALLDETEYIVDSVTKVKALKRGRQNTFSIRIETGERSTPQAKVTKPKSSPAIGQGKRAKVATLINEKPKRVPKSAQATVEKQEERPTSRSPTPPAAATRQMMRNGKYLFTEVEDEYFLRLAKHYLTCDPTISNTALVNKLHKKLPHHTAASWAAHVEKKLKGTLEDVRKRANIAKRKRDSETVNQNSLGLANGGVPYKDIILGAANANDEIPPNQNQPHQEDLERQDFDVITNFFASGGGDDDDDERVWQALEKHQRCRSVSSWPGYYAAHQEQVYARIEELTKECTGN